jgi:hypothetical protein
MSKPLMNRLLLENSNQPATEPPEASGQTGALDWNLNGSSIEWVTPQKSEDIRKQAYQIMALGDTDAATCRVLFRKVAKSLDNKDYVIAEQELRIKQLEARLEQLGPRKRRKVRTSPNSKFAEIDTIKQAQIEAGDRQADAEDSDSSENSDSTMDCIIVQE